MSYQNSKFIFKHKKTITIILIILVLVLSALLFLRFVELKSRLNHLQKYKYHQVFISNKSLKKGEQILAQDLKLIPVTEQHLSLFKDDHQAFNIKSQNDLVGKYLLKNIASGQILSSDLLSNVKQSVNKLDDLINKPGFSLFDFTVVAQGFNLLLNEGDFVDLYTTNDGYEIYKKLRILGIQPQGEDQLLLMLEVPTRKFASLIRHKSSLALSYSKKVSYTASSNNHAHKNFFHPVLIINQDQAQTLFK
jgi:hypothetical protein